MKGKKKPKKPMIIELHLAAPDGETEVPDRKETGLANEVDS